MFLLQFVRFGKDQVAVFVHRHPGTGVGVDVVVDIQGQQLARFAVRPGLALHDEPALAGCFVVTMEVGDADEVEHREDRLALGLARATAAHLLVQDGRAGEAREDQADHFRAVEAGVEHIHRDQDLGEGFLLEALDLGHAVDRVVVAHA